MEVQLVIKAPNQNITDQIINCNLYWTVFELKNHLAEVYPSKPDVQEQKLIYSGRLLHDHLHLKDILRHDDGQSFAHILHLVCNNCNSYSTQDQNVNSSQDWSSQPMPMQSDVLNTSELGASAGPSAENVLRHRNTAFVQEQNSFQPQFQPESIPTSTIPVFPSDPQILAQMAAMQQMYAYYMTQYMQSMSAAGIVGNNAVFPDIANFQQHNPTPNYAVNDAPPQRPVNQRMNAQGGQIEEIDDFGNRDWLDHLFLCCRFLIFFSIVYFYSTPERLMIVIVFAIIAFLYHEGWFVRRATPAAPADLNQRPRQNADQNPNAVNNANEVPLVNQNPSANEDLLDGHELEAAMDGDEPPHAQNPDVVNNNQIFSPLTFLAAFFSSLIPEPPPPVNIN